MPFRVHSVAALSTRMVMELDQITPLPKHAEPRRNLLEFFVDVQMVVAVRHRPFALVRTFTPFPAHPRRSADTINFRAAIFPVGVTGRLSVAPPITSTLDHTEKSIAKTSTPGHIPEMSGKLLRKF